MITIPLSLTIPPTGAVSHSVVVDVGAIGEIGGEQILGACLVALVAMLGGTISVSPDPDSPTTTITITAAGGKQADIGPIRLGKHTLAALGIFAAV